MPYLFEFIQRSPLSVANRGHFRDRHGPECVIGLRRNP